MKSIDINVPNIQIPEIDFNGFGNNIIDVISKIIDLVFSIISGVLTALVNFYQTLINVNDYMSVLVDSCKNNNAGSLPLIDIIGLYRFIVTDPVFYMTYMLVLVGCFFTIYKLIVLLIQGYTMIRDGVSVGKNTKVSFLEYLKRKIFK